MIQINMCIVTIQPRGKIDNVTNETILQEKYKGYVFDKLKRNDGLYQYIVYLPELKLTSRITLRDDNENYSYCYFKLYMFMDESKIKRKIRLMVV